ncbi:hypothetical protein D083_1025 [Dickeya solani RNS 08.23.3.1.A]|nr:hypothetical protein D083_1025 [Dickeya solani RNS 08.23.3.1.A]
MIPVSAVESGIKNTSIASEIIPRGHRLNMINASSCDPTG